MFVAQPHAASILGASILARFPLGMVPLALILLLREHGIGYGAAGIAIAVYTVSLGVSAPVLGRLMDARGRVRILAPLVVAYPAALAVLTALAVLDQPIAVVAAAAAVVGSLMPPVGSAVRSLWSHVLPAEIRTVAYSIEAALQEITFVIGPLLAAVLASASTVAAVVCAGLLASGGTALVLRQRPLREAPVASERHGGWLGAIASPGVRTVVLLCAVCGLCFGAVELAMPAFAEDEGNRALGGLGIAAFAAGSLLAGLATGTLHGVSDTRRMLVASACVGPATAVTLAAWSIPSMVALVFVAGLPIAPLIAACYGVIDRVALPGTHMEAFAWFGTAIATGVALGTGLAGALVDAYGARAALVLAAGAGATSVLVVLLRRSSLEPLVDGSAAAAPQASS
jgi:MFS family permease